MEDKKLNNTPFYLPFICLHQQNDSCKFGQQFRIYKYLANKYILSHK